MKLVFGDPESLRQKRIAQNKADKEYRRAHPSNGVPPANRTRSRWRLRSREVIARVIKENAGSDKAALKKALSEAYPFGMRQYTPYKLWLQEVKAALEAAA